VRPEYFECRCSAQEHLWRIWFDDDSYEPVVYASFFLAELPWYRRLAAAVKYIFGYKCRYGHFEEFILSPDDCDRMIGILQRLKEAKKT